MNIFLLLVGFIGLAAISASFVFVARNPVWAAYVFLATQPFIGGIDRGKLIPLLRPSEALQFFLTAAVLGAEHCGRLVSASRDGPRQRRASSRRACRAYGWSRQPDFSSRTG